MHESRICKHEEYGRHISLRCKNHPDLLWSTKNIDSIGCRSIFYLTKDIPECDCSARDLYHADSDCKNQRPPV